MPSTVVHLALAGLLAAGLLGDEFDTRAVAVVFAVTAFPDLDAFVGLVFAGTHRAAFHTLLLPSFGAALLYYDTRVRDRSFVRARWRAGGVRVAWVSLLAFAAAGIGLDLFTGGANPLYPLHDQFYRVNGRVVLSNQRGLVQTFLEFESRGGLGSTREVHVSSGVDPSRGSEPENVERIFPVVRSGWQLLLVITSGVVLGGRFRELSERRTAEE